MHKPNAWGGRNDKCYYITNLTSVHISVTFSMIMLQCLSNALIRPRSLWLFLQLIRTCRTTIISGAYVASILRWVERADQTWEFVFTLVVNTERGPVLNSSSSFFSSSSIVSAGAAIINTQLKLFIFMKRRSKLEKTALDLNPKMWTCPYFLSFRAE